MLPRGNAIEYLYDAVGRLTEIRRGTAVGSPSGTACLNASLARERTLYTLDAFGHRVNEKQETWQGGAWVTAAETAYEYSSGCHLDRVIQAPGTPEEAVTEQAYDCNGNLERVWDAEQPSAGQTNPATSVYAYDALDRLTSITQPWGGAGGGTAVTEYSYDVQDHLIAVTDAEGNVTPYVYSDRDLLTSEASPVSGTTTYTYNDHGELIESTDARGVTVQRIVDAADRVTLEDYPAPALDVTYAYGDQEPSPPPDSLGRLIAIERDGQAVDYGYDHFGRILQDGGLAATYDANGNRLTLGYPGGVTAVASYDFADRPTGLTVQRPGQPDQPVVTAAEYLPGGPLASLTLVNGLAETRTFDGRYQPERITLAGGATLLNWDYTTDGVGNVLSIADLLDPGGDRTYAYQDIQYFLTSGDGPWGSRDWTYDRIGNRLTETTGAGTDTYVYGLNGGGNTPVLAQVQLGAGGTRDYDYGPAGHLEQVTAGANPVLFTSDDAGRLAHLARPAGGAQTQLRYDGRGFLAQTEVPGQGPIFADDFETGDLGCWSAVVGGAPGNPANCPPPPVEPVTETEPLYSSEGLLHALFHSDGTGQRSRYLFYFAGRPVAQLEVPAGGGETWTFLTTDHLGTPTAATDLAGALVWKGGFEPFGRDWQAGTPAGAGESGLQLRLPGQWVDDVWEESTLGAEVYQNVFRWYEAGTGRYTRVDPVDKVSEAYATLLIVDPDNPYTYALQRPLVFVDPLGLLPDDPAGCVTRWVAAGAGVGAGIGAAVGGTAGAAAAGAACTPVAPGVGTVGCGAAGAAGGAAGGAAQGGFFGAAAGAIVGILDCTCDLSRIFRRDTPPDEIDCRKAKQICIEKCTAETLPTGTFDGAPFFKCLRECLDSFGC